MTSKTYSLLLSLLTIALLVHLLTIHMEWMSSAISTSKNLFEKSKRTKSLNHDEVKYMSYEASGKDWNEQSLILENAIVMAKLLNRTLIVRPVELIQLTNKHDTTISRRLVIPISRLLDLGRLRNLIPIIEYTEADEEFLKTFKNLTWHTVCHDTRIGFWVDKNPTSSAFSNWPVLRKTVNKDELMRLPVNTRVCTEDLERLRRNPSEYLIWAIENELLNISANMIYFSEGSLNIKNLYFTTFRKALFAQIWLKRHVIAAEWIRSNVNKLITRIGMPYDVIYIRKGNNEERNHFPALLKLSERLGSNATRTVYVTGDRVNETIKRYLQGNGFNLFTANDFADILGPRFQLDIANKDLLQIHEQLICAIAQNLYFADYLRDDMLIYKASGCSMLIDKKAKRFSPTWIGHVLQKPIF